MNELVILKTWIQFDDQLVNYYLTVKTSPNDKMQIVITNQWMKTSNHSMSIHTHKSTSIFKITLNLMSIHTCICKESNNNVYWNTFSGYSL